MLMFTLLIVGLLISIEHFSPVESSYDMSNATCNVNCDQNPFGNKILQNISLAEAVYRTPSFEVMVQKSSNSPFFSSGCITYIAIYGNTTFISFRYGVLTNGTDIVQIFLERQIDRGIFALVGFTDKEGPESQVRFDYSIAVACPDQPGAIIGLYRSYCYDSSENLDLISFSTFSTQPKPPVSCMKEITNTIATVTSNAGLPVPAFDNAKYTRPYKCVSKFNGIEVINAASIPKENSIELTS